MKVIALVNQKGGVAKTTTAASLAWGLNQKGKRVLAVDFDPQGNLSSSMGAKLPTTVPSAFEWIGCDPKATAPFKAVVQSCDGVDLIPADYRLAQAEVFLMQRLNRERFLDKAINSLPKNVYDYVIIDSPPSLGLLTVNILTAADEVLIPLKPEWLCYEGARALIETIRSIRDEVNPRLHVKGFLLTMTDRRRNVEDITDLVRELADGIKSKLFERQIRLNVAAADVASFQQSIYKYKPQSIAAEDYTSFVDEFLGGQVYAD
ncbi:MAG: AAA family ATPase [Firmicutes bacterium]|nr:AAA family ATPase [Bacillota bacterium]